MRPRPRRVSVDPQSPRAYGTSDRNGMINNHHNLVWQWDWAGPKLINKRILVSPDELDKPQRQLGTIVLPPDPVPIQNARVEPYAIDETYSYTNLMLRFDVNLTDSASPENLLTNNGNEVELVQTPSKFGYGSAFFDGASSFSASSQSWLIPDGNYAFTIDAWVYNTSVSGEQCIIAKNNSSGYGPYYLGLIDGSYVFKISSTGTSWDISDAFLFGTAVVDRWTHVALVRSCDFFSAYQDGFLQYESPLGISTFYSGDDDLTIGVSQPNSDYFNGYMSYLRYSNNAAFWVAPFTPPDQFEYTT